MPPERLYAAHVAPEACLGTEFEFVEVGSRTLKGFDDPVATHEIAWGLGDRA